MQLNFKAFFDPNTIAFKDLKKTNCKKKSLEKKRKSLSNVERVMLNKKKVKFIVKEAKKIQLI